MIQTEHLLIKPWAEAHASDFFDLTQDQGFHLHRITDYRQESIESSLNWIKSMIELHAKTKMGKFGVWERGRLIGMGGLTPWDFEGETLIDITYRLRESAWGKGLGFELAKALAAFGFHQLELPQITATITPENIASIKIAEKCGLRFNQTITLHGVKTQLYRGFKKDFPY